MTKLELDSKIEPAVAVRAAFAYIARERAGAPSAPLSELIARAAIRYELTEDERQWIAWSLDPARLALQSKEPA